MAWRANYWSCSKFANWIRGTPKPSAETSAGWYQWKKASKSSHPIRYWLAEEGLDIAQNIVNYPTDKLYELKYYIKNRYITITHSLTSRNLKRGQWYDMDTRILNCLFDELVNFVEIEKAHMHVACSKEEAKKYKRPSRWSLKEWRCKEAGFKHLEWEIGLKFDENWGVMPGHPNYGKSTPQAETAMEVVTLYNWWTVIRPSRDDPTEASGYYDLESSKVEDFDSIFDPKTPEEQKKISECFDVSNSIEGVYDNEDTEMLIRLIKVRKGLWT